MSAKMTRFTDAVYHKHESYDFEKTIFTRRMLKILTLVDGKKSVREISNLLSSSSHILMPEFAKLVKLGLIQTEGGIVSSGITDVAYSEKSHMPAASPVELTITRLTENLQPQTA